MHMQAIISLMHTIIYHNESGLIKSVSSGSQSLKDAINQVISDLDSGKSRVAEKINGEWKTHQYIKESFRFR